MAGSLAGWRDSHRAGSGGVRVGVSAGQAILEFCSAVSRTTRGNVHICPTAIVSSKGYLQTEPLINAVILWLRLGRIPDQTSYAALPPWPYDLRALANSEPYRSVLDHMNRIDIAFAGLGLIDPPQWVADLRPRRGIPALLQEMGVTKQDLIASGGFADLAHCVLTANGEDNPLWRYFLTPGFGSPSEGPAFYRQMVRDKKHVVVIAGGYKLPAIKAALSEELFNVLVTDEDTARNLME